MPIITLCLGTGHWPTYIWCVSIIIIIIITITTTIITITLIIIITILLLAVIGGCSYD